MKSKIIFKLIDIDGNFYLYDTNSNRILLIEEEDYSKLKNFNGKIKKNELKENFSEKFIREINKLRVLKESKFSKVFYEFSNKKELKDYINTHAESLVFILTKECNL